MSSGSPQSQKPRIHVVIPGLFDDDPIAPPVNAALVRRSISLGHSKKAKAVNRLLAQAESLRARFEREKRRLDEALIFHAAQVAPRQARATALAYGHGSPARRLSGRPAALQG